MQRRDRPLRGPQPPALARSWRCRSRAQRGRLMATAAYTSGYRQFDVHRLLGRAEPARQGRRRRRQGSDRPAQRDLHRARRDPPARRLRRSHTRRPDQPRRQPEPVLHRRRAAATDRAAAAPGSRRSTPPARCVGSLTGLAGGPWTFARFGDPTQRATSTPPTAIDPLRALERRARGAGADAGDGQRRGRAGDAARRRDRRHRQRARLHVGHERLEPADRDRVRHADDRPGRAAR